jgi:hypothetical protein
VVFIEYPVDSAPWSRNSRFWAAYGGSSVTLPEIIVDSGHQYTNGYEDFYNVYKGMVDAELTRPPQATVDALWWRDGDRVQFYARLTNLTGAILSWRNDATVHAVVYEDAHVADTDRFARAAVYAGVDNDLAPGAIADFALVTPDLTGVNWDKLHFLVLADYQPAGGTGTYDMLQAAVAVPATFSVTPDTYSFLVDAAAPADPSFPVHFGGPDWLTWSATTDVSWLAVTPGSGSVGTPPIVSLQADKIAAGWQEGHVSFTTTGGGPVLSDQILVRAYLGPLAHVYLPLIRR